MTKFTVERGENFVAVVMESGDVYEMWETSDFTQRKLNNLIKRVQKNYCGNAVFDIQL